MILIMAIAAIVAGCGNENAKQVNNSSNNNTAKQQEIEAENERLKAEAEALKQELAEKEESAKKEEEAEQTATLAAEEEEAPSEEISKDTQFADMMSMIIPYVAGDGAIEEVTYNYIVEHHELFPAVTADTKSAAKAEVDPDVTTRHIFKNITPYLDKMVKVSGYVVQIQEEETDYGTLAEIHIIDDNGNSIIGVYNNSTGDILDGDSVTMRGVPSALYSFDNVGGGTTNAVLLAVSTIQKSQ